MKRWIKCKSDYSQNKTQLKIQWLDILCSAAFKTHHGIISSFQLSITPVISGRVTKETQSDWPARHSKKDQHSKSKKTNKTETRIHILRQRLEKATLTKSKSKWRQSLRRVLPLTEVTVADFGTGHGGVWVGPWTSRTDALRCGRSCTH